MIDVTRILALLSCFGTAGKVSGDWVRGRCPFSPWKHDGGVDEHPSFGVYLGKYLGRTAPTYKCFSCQSSGWLEDLYLEVTVLHRGHPVGYDLSTAADIITADTFHLDWGALSEVAESLDYEKCLDSLTPAHITEFPEGWLSTFPRVSASHPYLVARRCTPAVVRMFDCRYDPVKERLCFPVRTFDGRLAGMQGRSTWDAAKLRYLTYTWEGQSNSGVWLNENNVNLDRPVVLVEGPFDALSVAAVYPNVLASLSAQISNSKVFRLADAPTVVTFFDNGSAGDSARSRVYRCLCKSSEVLHVYPSESKKDAGDMTPAEIRDRLSFLLSG